MTQPIVDLVQFNNIIVRSNKLLAKLSIQLEGRCVCFKISCAELRQRNRNGIAIIIPSNDIAKTVTTISFIIDKSIMKLKINPITERVDAYDIILDKIDNHKLRLIKNTIDPFMWECHIIYAKRQAKEGRWIND